MDLNALIQRLHDRRLDHAVMGLVIQAAEAAAWLVVLAIAGMPIVPAVILAAAIGWRVNVQHWLSREIRDVEIKRGLRLPGEFWKAWIPRNWHEDSRQDFIRPVVVGLLLGAAGAAVLVVMFR